MRQPLLLGLALVLLFASLAIAAPKFPKLTGRVVDDAMVLSPEVEAALDRKLAAYEKGTTNQIVVVTLPSLQGLTIEEFGYQLGRAWGIGQTGKNNGALLIVATEERKVRIEVGYGLEGQLTDALTSQIIHDIILPNFKDKNIEAGVSEGTTAILAVLGGKSIEDMKAGGPLSNGMVILIILFIIIFCIRYPTLAWFIFSNLPSSSYRGGSTRIGGGWSSGGFKGGGGSFGGGGSSGSW
ncbi:MAG: YgcG family protein [Alphaproteobacteria bacterium]